MSSFSYKRSGRQWLENGRRQTHYGIPWRKSTIFSVVLTLFRMNKYLMLVRRYVNATFLYLDKRSYPENLLSDIIETLVLVPLNSTDRKYPDGLRLHVLDVFLDELGHYLPKNEEGEPIECEEETKQRLRKFLEPVEELSKSY